MLEEKLIEQEKQIETNQGNKKLTRTMIFRGQNKFIFKKCPNNDPVSEKKQALQSSCELLRM